MKIIDLYNHAPSTIKLLVKIGAIPANWQLLHEQYRDYIKFGVAESVRIHHCSTRQPYRARDVMELQITLKKEDKEKIIQELQGLINLLNQNN
jgi:hypothetical protein